MVQQSSMQKPDRPVGRKLLFLPHLWGSIGILPLCLLLKNQNGVATRWRKKIEDMFICFHRIHKCDRQMDRQTDGQCMTAQAALTHSIAQQKLVLDKANWNLLTLVICIVIKSSQMRSSHICVMKLDIVS